MWSAPSAEIARRSCPTSKALEPPATHGGSTAPSPRRRRPVPRRRVPHAARSAPPASFIRLSVIGAGAMARSANSVSTKVRFGTRSAACVQRVAPLSSPVDAVRDSVHNESLDPGQGCSSRSTGRNKNSCAPLLVTGCSSPSRLSPYSPAAMARSASPTLAEAEAAVTARRRAAAAVSSLKGDGRAPAARA